MSDTIYVASRKGLFELKRAGAEDWRIVHASFVGNPVTVLVDDSRDGTLYAALNHGHFGVKLHRSDNGGRDWVERSTPAFPAAEGDGEGASLQQVWCLATGGPSQEGQLWAGAIPAGLFLSKDRGESWNLVRSLWDRPERENWFGGGYDDAGIHSICVDPRNADHVTVGISCGGVWVTRNGGESWECKTNGMYAEYMPPDRREDPDIQDPHRVVQCPTAPDVLWAQHHNGVFRTTDGGEQWSDVSRIKPSKFGFAVAVHPEYSETAWFVPGVKDECRVPVDGRMVVARTRDGGQSFEVLRKGLPQEHAYDIVYRHGLDVDASGRRLVMGSTTGNLWISENGGDSWSTVSTNLPPRLPGRLQALSVAQCPLA